MTDMIEAYPLHWPDGRPRLASYKRQNARFKTGFGAAVRFTVDELRRLGAKNPIVSTDVPTRRDGLPLASAKRPADPGVAVYFTYKGKQFAFACDKWNNVEDNIYAIGKSIEAMRGLERWGTGDMVDAAFQGFQALPAPGQHAKRSWRSVLGIVEGVPINADVLSAFYRTAAKRAHPDMPGGSNEAMSEVNAALAEGKRELGIA